MNLEILESRSFPDNYYSLAKKLEHESLFLSSQWFNNFLETVVKDDESVIWFGLKDSRGQPLFLMPLWRKPYSAWQAHKLESLSNYYTTLYEPLHCISDQHQQTEAFDLVVKSICKLDWDVLDIFPLNPASTNFTLLINAFKRYKRHVTPYFMYANWFLLIENLSFKDYYHARPGQLKNTIKRRTNKLRQKSVEYRIYTDPEDLASAIEHYQSTYNLSWKRNEPYLSFIPGLAQTAANCGWLR
ncbi:MAG: hypothetical protein ACU836_19075, partial [Gammaproteobacteria bacterium]